LTHYPCIAALAAIYFSICSSFLIRISSYI
jgi:hypothetical protein